MSETQIRIAPIVEGLSLKAKAYAALKTAIMQMNIYDDHAELKLDERDLSQRFGVIAHAAEGSAGAARLRRPRAHRRRAAASSSSARPRPRSSR